MVDRLEPRPHKSVDAVINDARRGAAFMVDRAVVNGDLAHLPEFEQRKIVAMAHDYAALYAYDCVVPINAEEQKLNTDFIATELDQAMAIFFKAGGKELVEQIRDFHKL